MLVCHTFQHYYAQITYYIKHSKHLKTKKIIITYFSRFSVEMWENPKTVLKMQYIFTLEKLDTKGL